MAQKPHHLNKSLDRGLRILDLFERRIQSLSAKEISDQLGVAPTTLYPFLHTLTSHGYLEVDEQKRYRLGLKLLERVGEVNQVYDIRAVTRRELVKLSGLIQANARLAVLYGDEVLYLEQEEGGPQANLSLAEVVGLRVPCHCTALGKVLLAYLPTAELSRMLNSLVLTKITEKTITDKSFLIKELDSVRAKGFSLELEELQLGGACVGAPIRNASGKVIAAISASIFASRAKGQALNLVSEAVMAAAAEISRQLGHQVETL